MKVSVVIPAYNEESRIGEVIKETKRHADRVLVIDDGSTDRTANISGEFGAEVVAHKRNKGYLETVKTGFHRVNENIVVTIDADGENDPEDIPRLVGPIRRGEADLVLGKREHVPRLSERFIDFLAKFVVKVSDTGTGFRALRADLAKKLELEGRCPCGTFVLEVARLGGRIREIPVRVRKIDKPRKIAWKHGLQIFYVLKSLLRFQHKRSV